MAFRLGKNARELDVEEASGFFDSFPSLRRCRICLEEEEQGFEVDEERSYAAMEAPCACSGTLKFAHRGCIQRWCDEKGNTLCEICLQSFRPGYTVASKRERVDVGEAIRGYGENLQREFHDLPTSILNAGSLDEQMNTEPFPASATAFPSGRAAKCSRCIAMTFTAILLVKNFISVMSLGAQYHILTLFALFGLRATGVLLPMILLSKSITAILKLQNKYRQQHRLHENDVFIQEPEYQAANQQHHAIQVDC